MNVDLPIYEIKSQLEKAWKEHNRILIHAPTGSGKSTQVPQILLEDTFDVKGKIVVLQPRRLAARLLARRITFERNTVLGEETGYVVRFDRKCSSQTRIRFETDGILLRQMLTDPILSEISVIIFDEFHERHVYGDVLLGLALTLQKTKRPDLKIIIMSATLDCQNLLKLLEPVILLESKGRSFPVNVQYLSHSKDPKKVPIWTYAARSLTDIIQNQKGDVLIFMPGTYEILKTIEAIRSLSYKEPLTVLPLYGELSPEQQEEAIKTHSLRKIIVSTNVAETSITIEGITAVIDSGLARKSRFDPYRGINTLLIEKISQASADQRSGRSGRTKPGFCLRLWTEKEHLFLPKFETPEIHCIDLCEIILLLKALKIESLERFPWIDTPLQNALSRSEGLLADLGALKKSGEMTPLGRQMLAFPLHPRYSRMLLSANQLNCVSSICLIAAITQERSFLTDDSQNQKNRLLEIAEGEEESDLIFLSKIWRFAKENQFRISALAPLGIHAGRAKSIEKLYYQFLAIARENDLNVEQKEWNPCYIRKSLFTGFADQLAFRKSKGSSRFSLTSGRAGTLDKKSNVRDRDLIVALEIHERGSVRGTLDVLLSLVTAVDMEWIRELFPEQIFNRSNLFFDPEQKKVIKEEQTFFKDLLIASHPNPDINDQEAAHFLAKEIENGNITLKKWDHITEQWIIRLNFLCQWCPELNLPKLQEEDKNALYEQICLGARSAKEVKDREVSSIVMSWLSAEQQWVLDKYAPARVRLSNGKTPKVTYEPERTPYISLRIQELYDVNEAITVAKGKIKVLIHILAPNHRPVQITDDLPSFWKSFYPKIKKELCRRYPKHEWREH